MSGADAPLPRRRRTALLAAAVAGLALLVHLPSLSNGFAWDDPRHVVANESLHGLDRLGEVITSPYLRDTHPSRSPWRPVTSVSYAASWAMGGGAPFPFHLLNVTLHAVASVGVLALLTALGATLPAAGVGAALFAVHPVHVEAVANVVGRGDVLMTLAVLAAVLLWLRRDLPAAVRVAGVGLATLLAAGSKEMGVVVPALLVVVEAFRGRGGDPAGEPGEATRDRDGLLRRLRADAPVLAASVAAVALYMAGRRAVLGTFTTLDVAPYIAALPDGLRVSTAVANLAEVARLLLFPRELAADYAPAVIEPARWTSARFALGVTVAGAAAAAAWLSLRRGRGWVAAGTAWAAVAFLPVSNLVVEVPIWVAERTLYLPSVGVALAVVGVVAAVGAHGTPAARRGLAALAVVAVLAGGVRSWSRSATWASSDTVLATLVEEHPESFRAQWWIARQLMERGMEERALERYAEAVAVNPNDAFVTLDYARALILAGRPGQAEALLAPVPPGLDASRSVYMAQALLEQGRTEEAAAAVREGLERFPSDARLRGQAERLGIGADASAPSGPSGRTPGTTPDGTREVAPDTGGGG